MDTLERYWYLALLVLVGAVWLWFAVSLGRGRSPNAARGIVGWFAFGPFWPRVDDYFSRRGGFTRREWFGWGVVLVLMFGAVLFTGSTRA